MATGIQVVFDCADPDRLARFWATALHYRVQDPPEGFTSWKAWLADAGVPESEWNSASAIVDPDGAGPRVYFQRVPEGKVVKNRVHLDLNASSKREVGPDEGRRRVDAEVERLRSEGGTVVRPGGEERGEYWVVMQDPEGNEFCVQ
jgi:hypothetical protein